MDITSRPINKVYYFLNYLHCTYYVHFSGATLQFSYQLCLEVDIVGDHIRPTFEKLLAH